MPTVEDILDIFEKHGDSEYGGECVSQLEHALQTATLAERQGATSMLVVAALLHDVGHLLHDLPDDAPDDGIDDNHERLGCQYLRDLFPADVTEPVRLHVPAKRCLCAVDDDYLRQLSEPSLTSLQLQGGPMTQAEVKQFLQIPFAEDALSLRRWDDAAKDPQMATRPLSHFTPYLQQCAVKP